MCTDMNKDLKYRLADDTQVKRIQDKNGVPIETDGPYLYLS